MFKLSIFTISFISKSTEFVLVTEWNIQNNVFFSLFDCKIMNMKKIVLAIGIIITILGGIFHLQGQSVVGPESSFMYSNPEWISYGLQILTFGMILVGIGIGLTIKRSKQ